MSYRLPVQRLLAAALAAWLMAIVPAGSAMAVKVNLTEEDVDAIKEIGKDKDRSYYLEYLKQYAIPDPKRRHEQLIVFTPFLDMLGVYLRTKKPDGTSSASMLRDSKNNEDFFLQVETFGPVLDFHANYKLVLRQNGKLVPAKRALRVPTRRSNLGADAPPYRGVFLVYYRLADVDFSQAATFEVIRDDGEPSVYTLDWSKYR